jgi:C4-type Zn-finger protein
MTPTEHANETTRLTGVVTRAKSALQKSMALVDKIEAKAKVRSAEEALRQHKLNYHVLTGA